MMDRVESTKERCFARVRQLTTSFPALGYVIRTKLSESTQLGKGATFSGQFCVFSPRRPGRGAECIGTTLLVDLFQYGDQIQNEIAVYSCKLLRFMDMSLTIFLHSLQTSSQFRVASSQTFNDHDIKGHLCSKRLGARGREHGHDANRPCGPILF